MNTIPDSIPQKQCTDCKGCFPADLTHFPPAKPGKLKPRCRNCTRAQYKAWKEQNQEHRNAYMKKWHREHKAEEKEYSQQRKDQHRLYQEQHTNDMKRCRGCSSNLPATVAYFHKDAIWIDGLYPYCKKCRGKGRTFGIEPFEEKGKRRCTKCMQIFPATIAYFNKAREGKFGLSAHCKRCRGKGRTFGKDLPPVDKDEKCCTDCLKVFPKTSEHFYTTKSIHNDGFQATCKQCSKHRYKNISKSINEQRRMQRQANPEKFRNLDKKRYVRDIERMREKNRSQYKKHKVVRRKKAIIYQNTHREIFNISNHNYRARKKSIVGVHTVDQILDLLKRQRYCCYYCQKKFQRVKGKYVYHIEHTFPVSRIHGSDIPANDISYLVLACPTCNLEKGNKFPWEWSKGGKLL
jgi:hypothetical protein